MEKIVLALTGASGAVYGLRLTEELLRSGRQVVLLLSQAGRQVVRHETGLDWTGELALRRQRIAAHFQVGEALQHYDEDDLFAPVASGSAAADAMVVAPCSMGCVGRIAAGLSGNLIERCADVALKEGKSLLLVPRETPFNQLHLENLLRLSKAGARIVPAMPAFYQQPASVEEMIDFVVGKVLDQLGIDHRLYCRWGDG
ncbi:MAG: flavin prenyltransferase UbiX [Syntrophotaleaceae bacterium]